MKIIGFAISKISVERKNPTKGKLEIKSNINIDNIEKEDIAISDKTSLKFEFTYSVNYVPDMANLEIRGAVIVLDDENESKEILRDWKKKKFIHKIKIAIFNFILDKCNIKAIQLEDELGLPLHIPLPKLTPKPEDNKANYTG